MNVGISEFPQKDTLIDFDDLGPGSFGGRDDGEVLTSQFAELGVVFSNSFASFGGATTHANSGLASLAGTNSGPNVVFVNHGGSLMRWKCVPRAPRF